MDQGDAEFPPSRDRAAVIVEGDSGSGGELTPFVVAVLVAADREEVEFEVLNDGLGAEGVPFVRAGALGGDELIDVDRSVALGGVTDDAALAASFLFLFRDQNDILGG
jgi:hypothetical protein